MKLPTWCGILLGVSTRVFSYEHNIFPDDEYHLPCCGVCKSLPMLNRFWPGSEKGRGDVPKFVNDIVVNLI